MSNSHRGGGQSRPRPYYDQQQHGMVDPNTGEFTPNIGSGGTPRSAFDRASEGSFDRAFPSGNQNVQSATMRPNGDRVDNAVMASGPMPARGRNPAPTSRDLLTSGSQPQTGGRGVPTALANSDAIQSALDRATGDTHSQYGTGSVSFAKPGTPEPTPAQTSAATTPTGVQHSWQADVLSAHPDVGIAGSPANTAFVNAYKTAQASGQPIDHMALAEQTLSPLYVSGQAKRGGSGDLVGPKYADRSMPGKASAQSGLTPQAANPTLAKTGHPTIATPPPNQGGISGMIGNAWDKIGQVGSDILGGAADTARGIWNGTPAQTAMTPPNPQPPVTQSTPQHPLWRNPLGASGY